MTSDEIKTGATVVADFLQSLNDFEGIDAATVETIQELSAAGKLTKTRLLRSLEEARLSAAQTQNSSSGKPHD
jgi:hypothetical protein